MGCHRSYLSLNMSADWPVRIFYGLVTAYQGLYGLFVPGSVFYRAMQLHEAAVLIIGVLLAVGLLLVIDGVLAMFRYCTPLSCEPIKPLMLLFHRWRHLLFLPPVFCYFATLVAVNRDVGAGVVVVNGYYLMLAAAGVAFCLRDGIVSQTAMRGGHE